MDPAKIKEYLSTGAMDPARYLYPQPHPLPITSPLHPHPAISLKTCPTAAASSAASVGTGLCVGSPHKPEPTFMVADEISRRQNQVMVADEISRRNNQVSTAVLHDIPIVCLCIEGTERLCLAQISNTLLKEYSYNEIHNRRVALGITCVQCTPVQLEILRRAGAMPISSRRCGMITKREADRLVKSFLEEHVPPKLPENFVFRVCHRCGWGCKGRFMPSRYNSSRAKCIICDECKNFFSPNKFIFHAHKIPNTTYNQPDAANFNSWRRHLLLDYEQQDERLMHAWEDVKAMFNGGSRKRVISIPSRASSSDGDYFPEENKRGQIAHQPYALPCSPSTSRPFSFMPIPSSPNMNNMMVPFPPPATPYPSLTPIPDEKRVIESTGPKLNLNEFWKRSSSHFYHAYNPFSLWWGKMCSFGAMKSNLSSTPADWQRPEAVNPTKPHDNATDSRYSAFKPVGMLGSRVFSEYGQLPVFPGALNTESRSSNMFNSNRNSTGDMFPVSPESSSSTYSQRNPLKRSRERRETSTNDISTEACPTKRNCAVGSIQFPQHTAIFSPALDLSPKIEEIDPEGYVTDDERGTSDVSDVSTDAQSDEDEVLHVVQDVSVCNEEVSVEDVEVCGNDAHTAANDCHKEEIKTKDKYENKEPEADNNLKPYSDEKAHDLSTVKDNKFIEADESQITKPIPTKLDNFNEDKEEPTDSNKCASTIYNMSKEELQQALLSRMAV